VTAGLSGAVVARRFYFRVHKTVLKKYTCTALVLRPMLLTPLADIDDDQEFYRGNIFRKFAVGMNVNSKEDYYYDYMLVDNTDPHMILVNVSREASRHKAGAVIAYVNKLENDTRIVVTAKAVKYSLGTKNIFLLHYKYL
jgi:hypothetical protein